MLTYWMHLKLILLHVYLSIEPQDLATSGSIYAGTLIPSINYCNSQELPLKYK